jgi:hypothetical protein
MQQITSILNYANQSQNLILSDGTSLVMQMYFSPQQLGWFITSLTYGNFTLNGLRITNSPNMLHQFRNQIPFGLACFSTDDREPQFQQDFSSGASILYLLSAAEVEQYEEFLTSG